MSVVYAHDNQYFEIRPNKLRYLRVASRSCITKLYFTVYLWMCKIYKIVMS